MRRCLCGNSHFPLVALAEFQRRCHEAAGQARSQGGGGLDRGPTQQSRAWPGREVRPETRSSDPSENETTRQGMAARQPTLNPSEQRNGDPTRQALLRCPEIFWQASREHTQLLCQSIQALKNLNSTLILSDSGFEINDASLKDLGYGSIGKKGRNQREVEAKSLGRLRTKPTIPVKTTIRPTRPTMAAV